MHNQTHKNAAPFRNKGWALYDDAASLFDKVSADGRRAHRPGTLRGAIASPGVDDNDTGDDAPGGNVEGTNKEDIDDNNSDDGSNDGADSNKDGGSMADEVVPEDEVAAVPVSIQPKPKETPAVTPKPPSSKAAGKRRHSRSPSITDDPDPLDVPKPRKKSKKNPNLIVLEELIDQFGTMNNQLQIGNAIDLHNSRQVQASTPASQHSEAPTSTLPVIPAILSPRSARHEEAFEVLGKKDAPHFNTEEIVLLCELFEDKAQAATYIAMSKSLPDNARRRWLQRKLYGPSDPTGMAMHLTAIEQYGSPYPSDNGSPSAGSALLETDVFQS
jgi:hypothetical protein